MDTKIHDQLVKSADLLYQASYKIKDTLTHESLINIRARVLGDILKTENLLRAMAKGEQSPEIAADMGTPVRFMLGRPVNQTGVVYSQEFADNNTFDTEVLKQDATKDHEGEELNTIVQKLYPEFSNMEPDVILDSLSDLEIRGVAKKAGLPVTENFPKKLDTLFINQIKEAIAKRQLLDDIKAGSKQGTENTDNEDGVNEEEHQESNNADLQLSLEELLNEKIQLEEAIHNGEQSKIHHTKIKSLKNKLSLINENIEKLSE